MTIDLESWQAIGGALGLVVVGVANRWDNRRQQKKAIEAAEKAAKLSEPTGNGFAKRVTASLIRIEAAQARTEQKIDDHIAAHADAEIASRPRRILRDVNEL